MSECPQCGRRFESPKGLKAHLRDRHRGYYFLKFMAPWITLLAVAVVGAATILPYLSTPTSPSFEIYYSPDCGCCGEYVKYLKSSGVEVRTILSQNIAGVKERLNIPHQLWSCHTSVVEGYFVEGHVPLEAVRKLLEERPKIDGIALPGMPAGSPGMGGVNSEPLTIYAVDDGETSVFMYK